MKFVGKFVFKNISKVDAGKFTNDKGEIIEYPASYKVLLDDWIGDKLNEVILKISSSSVSDNLVNQLKQLRPYTNIELECELSFYSNGIRVVPVSLIKADSNNK